MHQQVRAPRQLHQPRIDLLAMLDVYANDEHLSISLDPETIRSAGMIMPLSGDDGVYIVDAGVKRLALTHHDPDHDDEFLDRIEKLCRERFSNTVLAREGMEIQIGEAPEAMPRAPGRLSRRTRLTSSSRR